MQKKFILLASILTVFLSIKAVSIVLDGQFDIGILDDYENPNVPNYVFSEDVHDRAISDEMATLGRVLFYDKQLSLNGSLACAGCHKQEFAFGDTLVASPGFDKVNTERHSTRLVNLNFSHLPEVFWDQRAGHLDSLPLMVLSNSIEMGFSGTDGQPTIDSLVRRVKNIPYYQPLFEMAYGDQQITDVRMNLALTQFVRSIVSYDSKYDVGRMMVDSNTVDFPNFTADENAGKALYLSDFGETITDSDVHFIQGPQGIPGQAQPPLPSTTHTHSQFHSHVQGRMGCADCHGIDNFTTRKTSLTGNNGIIGVIDHPSEIDTSVKRSPSLRDLINPAGLEVGPFMHDGSLSTLEEVMEHYAEIGYPGKQGFRLHPNLNIDVPNGSYTGPASGPAGAAGPVGPGGFGFNFQISFPTFPPRVNSKETEQLIAFLKTLTGKAIYTDEKWSDPFGENGELNITNDCVATTPFVQDVKICEGESYEGHFRTGQYRKRIPKSDGCDSIVLLNLTVDPMPEKWVSESICEGESLYGFSENVNTNTIINNSTGNGCDTILHMDLNIIRPIYKTIYNTICEGDSFEGYTTEGVFKDTFPSFYSGCDSIRTIRMSMIAAPTENVEVELCEGESYRNHTTTGIYLDTIVDPEGCYIFSTLDLNVKPKSESYFQSEICEGETFMGYQTTGSFIDLFTAANGCDSIRQIDLLVNSHTESLFEVEICAGESYEGYSEEGVFTDQFVNAQNCDSTRYILLTVLDHSESFIEKEICAGEYFEGYSETGNYVDMLQNAAGCDSTRNIALTILEHSESITEMEICTGDTFWGYSETGFFIDVLSNAVGCDSVRHLDLRLLSHSDSYEEVHLCPGEDFEGYTEGLHEEYYTNAVGCDSTRVIEIVNIDRKDAICAMQFEDDVKMMSETAYMATYPNPVVNELVISIDKPERLPATLKIFDTQHQLVMQKELTDKRNMIDISQVPSGLYMILVQEGRNGYLEKILKI